MDASLTLATRKARKREEEDDHDEYYEYEDERPSIEPVDRPTDERGERPMRSPVSPRWGPNRRNSR